MPTQREVMQQAAEALGELVELEADGREASVSSIESWERARASLTSLRAALAQPEEGCGIERLGNAIAQALDDAPVADVLSLLTGAFVSLTVELVRRQGHHDDSLPIKVDGGQNRDITIHPPKLAPPTEGSKT